MSTPYNKEENAQAWTAWEFLTRTNVNIFLTGRAGTGKTTFLKRLRDEGCKQMVIVAPTGVAAINAGGVTLHSFFQLPLGLTLPGQRPKMERGFRKAKLKTIRRMDLLVIDEVSMVRADLLDAVDSRLREVRRSALPFGGVQLLLIGDLHQLSPVVPDAEVEMLRPYYETNYFFSSKALQKTTFYTIELQKIYRQTDSSFISLLNKVRDNALDAQSLAMLNSHYRPSFNPPESEKYIRLTTHNASADNINSLKLAQLDGRVITYNSEVKGTFPEKSYPADGQLILKIGAQVMFLKNDTEEERRFYNGKIGTVIDAQTDKVIVNCNDKFGNITVTPQTWDNMTYENDPETGEIKQKIEGTFTQMPLCLAWAITIHKSQGLTFDRAIIDAGRSFSAGQVYVALSRCRTFEGLVLSSPITMQSVITDRSVNGFLYAQEQNSPGAEAINSFAADYAIQTVATLLDFRPITIWANKALRLLQENYSSTYPKVIAAIEERLMRTEVEITATAKKFISLCENKKAEGINVMTDATLNARAVGGAKYFDQKTTELLDDLTTLTNISLANKAVDKDLKECRTTLAEETTLKHAELRAVAAHGFSPEVIMRAKAETLSAADKDDAPEKRKSNAPSAEELEVTNKSLYANLKRWRFNRAKEIDAPAFVIASDKVLICIADSMPETTKQLLAVPGMGPAKVKTYGIEILKIVSRAAEAGMKPTLPLKGRDEIETVTVAPEKKKEKEKKEKEEKEKTWQISARLFKELGSVEKVASERGFVISTIKSHLLNHIDENGLDAEDVIGKERLKNLLSALKKLAPDDVEAGKAIFALGYDYSEVRYARQLLEKSGK